MKREDRMTMSAATSFIPGRRILLGLGGCMIFALLHFLLLTSTYDMMDDAYIYFRYVSNWVAGHGLTWNPGHEPVEGYTSFLFVLLLAIPAALGANLPAFVQLANLILLFALMYAMAGFVAAGIKGWKSITLVAPLLAATSSQVIMFTRNGMETVLFSLLIVVALGVASFGKESRRSQILSGVLFGFLALTRPDGILAYIVYVGYAVAASLLGKRPLPVRGEMYRAAGLLAVLVPHLVFRVAYYGELLPNTFYAKVGLTVPGLVRGLKAVLSYLTSFRGGLFVGAVGLWALAPRTRAGNVLGLFLLVWLVYLGSIGLSNLSWWYAMPLDVVSILWLGWSLAKLLEASGGHMNPRRLRLIGPAALGLLCVANLAFTANRALANPTHFAQGLYREPSDLGHMISHYVKVGRLIGDMAETDETMAVAECGAIPYYAGIVTYDAVGLNDKHIARQPASPGVWAFGHEKGDGHYLLAQKPTYIVMKPFLTQQPDRIPVGVPSWVQMYGTSEFERDYAFVSVSVDGLYFNYYRRRAMEPN